ncbi:MAG: GerMN domain-containing protein [Actinomycetota bacterium]
MLDLERELREVLSRAAERAAPSPPAALPALLRRRLRRRQAVTSAVAGFAAMAVALVTVGGLALVRQDRTEPANPTPPFEVFQPPRPQPGAFLLARGTSGDEVWEVAALDDGGVQIEARSGGDAIALGDIGVPGRVSLLHTIRNVGVDEVIRFGAVVPEANSVEVGLADGGAVPGAVLSLSPAFDVSFVVFVVAHPREGADEIVFEDEDGQVVAREVLDNGTSPPIEPEPGDEVSLSDHFGNPLGTARFESTSGIAWTPPGGAATIGEMRETANHVFTGVLEGAANWWRGRPTEGASEEAFENWWSDYPIRGALQGEPEYAVLADCVVPPNDGGPPPGASMVYVFYPCVNDPAPLPYTVHRIPRAASGVSPLTAALTSLVRGPSRTEREHGFGSFFSDRSADLLISAEVDGSGHAIVDFRDFRDRVDGNSTTTTGGAYLLTELYGTVFQFETIDSVEFRMEGSCERFGRWFESRCSTVTRATAMENARIV